MAVCSEHLLLLISRRFLSFGTKTWIICCRLQTPRLIRKTAAAEASAKDQKKEAEQQEVVGGIGALLEEWWEVVTWSVFFLLRLSERSRKDRRKDE